MKTERDVEYLAAAFNLVKKETAFGISRNKRPLQKRSELMSLENAICLAKSEMFNLDVCAFLPYISAYLDYYERNAVLCMIDVDKKDWRLLESIGRYCYAEESTNGYHLFLYTDSRLQKVYIDAEIITHKFARFTARLIEPYGLPFFRDSSFIVKEMGKFFSEPQKRAPLIHESMSGKMSAEKASWVVLRDALIRHGWVFIKEDGRYEYWRRPGAKTSNHDAVYHKERDRWQVFSVNTGFDNRSYFIHEAYNLLANCTLL